MLENRLYKTILIMASVLSVLSVVGNFLAGFPLSLNWKWATLLLVSLVSLKTYKNHWHPLGGKVVYFLYLILVFLPFAFVDSGGSANNAIGYVFLLLICIVYIFKGRVRNGLVGALIIVFILLHGLEYHYPAMIAQHSPASQFRDRLIQIPLIQLACFFIIKNFADAYDKQKRDQENYRDLLEDMNEKLGRQANYDELTKLQNRRAFNEILKQINDEGKMIDHEMYVVLFDLDKFKEINDTLGHLVADEILVQFSDRLKPLIDDKIILSRWGGDEFSMIIEADRSRVLETLENVQRAYENVVEGYGVKSKVSFGGVCWDKGSSPDEVLTKADKALYEAKEKGRGRIQLI